jgi:hypothetical protein
MGVGQAGYNKCDRQSVTYISLGFNLWHAIDSEEKAFAVQTMVLAKNQERLNSTMQ